MDPKTTYIPLFLHTIFDPEYYSKYVRTPAKSSEEPLLTLRVSEDSAW